MSSHGRNMSSQDGNMLRQGGNILSRVMNLSSQSKIKLRTYQVKQGRCHFKIKTCLVKQGTCQVKLGTCQVKLGTFEGKMGTSLVKACLYCLEEVWWLVGGWVVFAEIKDQQGWSIEQSLKHPQFLITTDRKSHSLTYQKISHTKVIWSNHIP